MADDAVRPTVEGCAATKEFVVGHESVAFTCERKMRHGRHVYHRASWGLFAQIEWVDAGDFIGAVGRRASATTAADGDPQGDSGPKG